MIIFIRYLILLAYISTNHCFSIIIIDIEPHNKSIALDSTGQRVQTSLRVLTFDTDAQRITQIDFLSFNHRSTEINRFSSGALDIEFTPSNMANFLITPATGFKGIIRKCGDFTYNLSGRNSPATSLSYLDETRSTLMGAILLDNFAFDAFDDFSTALNRHDVLARRKQEKIDGIRDDIEKLNKKDVSHQDTKPSAAKYKKSQEQLQKNGKKRQELLQRISNIQSGAEVTKRTGITYGNLQALVHWNTHERQTPVGIFLTRIYNSSDLGELCELTCDLTMMGEQFIKLDGKYDGNKGFDGLYKRYDRIVAAESKFWKSPPTLHTVISEKIIPKFDFSHDGAIRHISEKSIEKIKMSYEVRKIYMLPYTMFCDGSIDCRLEHFTGEIDFPQPVIEKETRMRAKVKTEPSGQEAPKTPLASLTGCDILSLTAESDSKQKQSGLKSLLSLYMDQTQMSPEELRARLMAYIITGNKGYQLLR